MKASMMITENSTHADPKIVLYWTKYFEIDDLTFGFGREPFIKAGCHVDNCVATKDRSLVNKSAAIMFHSQAYKEGDLPVYRQPHQRYVFMLYETLPFGRKMKFFHAKHVFNWTMTHRRDSDIYDPKPYGIIRRTRRREQLPELLQPGEQIASPRSLLTASYPQFANRTKLVAWMCSNCHTDGRREIYFKRWISTYLSTFMGNVEIKNVYRETVDIATAFLTSTNSIWPPRTLFVLITSQKNCIGR